MTELAEIVVGWPLFASLALATVVRELRAGRRRGVLNEALHELRRPLQAIALASGPTGKSRPAVESSVQLAAAALERLERAVNGGTLEPPVEAIDMRPLLESAVRRWHSRAALGGASLSVGWEAGAARVDGDRITLAQALDNLLVNAIEHGGPSIAVGARLHGQRLRVVVADSGRASRSASRRGAPAETIARLTGRRRRGHGLAVVKRIAAEHDGRFSLHGSERGSRAVLELPLSGGWR